MNNLKIAIAGAGTGGLAAAIELAKAGFEITVLEAKKEENYYDTHNWSDAVEYGALKEVGFDMPEILENSYSGALVKTYPVADDAEDEKIFEPHRINPLHVFDPEYRCEAKTPARFEYILVDRKALCRKQVKDAKNLGVNIVFDAPVSGLLGDIEGSLSEIKVTGIKALIDGSETDMNFDLVVDATGAQSKLRKMLGASEINIDFPKDEFALVYRTIRHYSSGGKLDTFLDQYRYCTHKGYFWIQFQNGDADGGMVDIGGGVPSGDYNAKDIVNEMVASYPQLSNEEIRGGSGIVHIGFPPDALVASGFAVLGDAASQSIPSNGCGVGATMIAAKELARVVKAAKGTGIEDLWEYAAAWYRGRGADYAALFSTNKVLTVLTHDEIYVMIKRNIMGGKMLNYNFNGLFPPQTLSSVMQVLPLFFSNRKLFSQLLKASVTGKKFYQHYKKYPLEWNQAALTEWISTK